LPAKANNAAGIAFGLPLLDEPGHHTGFLLLNSNTNTSTKGKRKTMAIVLEANYSKKLGLPGYSSHQYSVTLRTEVADLSQVEVESTRLHGLLQASVDREIQKTGFLPESNGNGLNRPGGQANGNSAEAWACSSKQRDLIVKIVEENKLDKNQVEALAQDRFGKSVRALNKLEASGLIDELITQTGGTPNGNRGRRFTGRPSAAPAR
jgi:hypothetical protein